ncbi:hypothetical protein CEXT_773731 [Caerostris extrusa]|uniref:Uncharacterized protein n=1 Tax=Caerostris extrusa TaxID=172846 RepID=A0AAV4UQZ6_CAEEX|nr:hypothetical protein CEXT_773731 [Caerostris extrusa]
MEQAGRPESSSLPAALRDLLPVDQPGAAARCGSSAAAVIMNNHRASFTTPMNWALSKRGASLGFTHRHPRARWHSV